MGPTSRRLAGRREGKGRKEFMVWRRRVSKRERKGIREHFIVLRNETGRVERREDFRVSVMLRYTGR